MSPVTLAARNDAAADSQNTPNLQAVRAELDALDNELLALIERRQGLARRIGDLKGASAPGLKLRPDREAEVLRRIAGRAEPDNRRAVQALWREVMSAGLSVQGQVEVAVWSGARKDSQALARARFGGSADYREAASPEAALAAAEADGVAVLALDPDTAWWAELPEREGLWVFDAIGRRGPSDPAVLCIASLEPSVLARGVRYRVSSGGDSGGDGRAEQLVSVSQGKRLYAVIERGRGGVLDRAHGVIGCAPVV